MLQLTGIPPEFIADSIRFKVPVTDATAGLGTEGASTGAAAGGIADAPADATPRHALTANVFTISIGGLVEDREAKMDIVGQLALAFGAESVKKHVRLTPAVIALDWPTDEKYADYALREIRRIKGDDQDAMTHIPWLDHFTTRGADGKMIITPEWPPGFEHHVGCLFAHLFAWQLALDMHAPHTVVFESDGVSGANLAVNPAPRTLHPAPCTLHPAPCTLHPDPAPKTPDPRPQTPDPRP
jgi:hypothetical protein